jgi:hypothetical protein
MKSFELDGNHRDRCCGREHEQRVSTLALIMQANFNKPQEHLLPVL